MSREEFRHEELAYEEWVGHWEPEPEPKPKTEPILSGIATYWGEEGKRHELYRVRQKRSGYHYGTAAPKRYAEHHLDATVKRVVWRCRHGDASVVEFKGKIVPARKVDGKWKFFPEETPLTECTQERPIRILGGTT